jgi:transposase-like protein
LLCPPICQIRAFRAFWPNRWVLKYERLLEQNFCNRKRPVGPSWRLDETYVRVKGAWKYLYRAVDKAGATVDFLLTAKRDRKAAPERVNDFDTAGFGI